MNDYSEIRCFNGLCPLLHKKVNIRIYFDSSITINHYWKKKFFTCQYSSKNNCDKSRCPVYKEALIKSKD